jgi:Anti-sigma-K factor rskA, C-terminal/Putative zinc-finger
MGERCQDPRGNLRGRHAWAWELLGPYVLGALDSKEEGAVERHVAECATCQEEERGLREAHEQLAGVSVAASTAPLHLKARVLAELPPQGDGETPTVAARSPFRFTPRMGWLMAAAMVLLVVVLPAAAYSSGFFDQTRTATLAPTELAPGAGGGLEVRGSGPNVETSLEVWGLPQTGPDEYYELWFGNKDEKGRVGAATFTVDPEGGGKLSGSVPELVGTYQRIDVTLERFPEEPRIGSAKAVLSGDLGQP